DVGGAQPRGLAGVVARGAAAVESAALPERGVVASINLPRLDVNAWTAQAGALSGAAPPPLANAKTTGAASADAASRSAAELQAYLPTAFDLRTAELNYQGRNLTSVVASGSRDGPVWGATVESAELAGKLEYRQAAGATGARVMARLSRLRLTSASASEVENLLQRQQQQPVALPALDIVIDDFELRGKKLGRVEIDAVNRSANAPGGGREWRLNKLRLTLPEAEFNATGNWALAPAPVNAAPGVAPTDRRRTAMTFTLDIADSGELLKRFGMIDVVRRGKGRLEGQIEWSGSPLELDVPSLRGQFNVNVESGQFVKADPGIGKLLGVLSLQALPRRLTLDFRDVFSEGFAFDFVRGDVTIARGSAQTNNLQMRGVNAAVLMAGSADIASETQALRVVVVPEIDAGTASLIATVINPAIGLGTFLAQLFLRRPLMEAATREFLIDGTWTDPKVTPVERRPRSAQGAGETKPER
ncbi:MAG: TIGR02099 family protein, partial [Polaromonas sp.]|nr:TIGR02099 family protein [Polaromonas sp.]